jgi:periplasmic divalent cation tolerance protein
MKGDDPNLARVVMVTHPNEADARTMAAKLVESGAAACVTVVPGAISIYKDGDKLVEAAEVQMLIKTREGVIGSLKHRIIKMHPYDNPELLVLPTDGGSSKFIGWIGEQTAACPAH